MKSFISNGKKKKVTKEMPDVYVKSSFIKASGQKTC